MTNKDVVKLAEKYGGVWGQGQSKLYIVDQLQLAAMIAEVRRQAMEECLLVCKEADYFGDVYDVIRARMEEGK